MPFLYLNGIGVLTVVVTGLTISVMTTNRQTDGQPPT